MVSSRLLYVDRAMALFAPPSTDAAPGGSWGSEAASQCSSRASGIAPRASGSNREADAMGFAVVRSPHA